MAQKHYHRLSDSAGVSNRSSFAVRKMYSLFRAKLPEDLSASTSLSDACHAPPARILVYEEPRFNKSGACSALISRIENAPEQSAQLATMSLPRSCA